MFSAGV